MTLLGVVLAGGRSSRMGQDKAGLVWGGKTFLEHQASLLQDVGCDAVVVAGRDDSRWLSLPDERPFGGPVAALAHVLNKLAGMFAVAPGKIVVVPVDMPLVGYEHVITLVGHPAPLVAFAGHPFPCVLAVTQEVIETVTLYAGQSGVPLKGLWDRVPGAMWIANENEGFLTNINTPAEWSDFKRNHGGWRP